MNWQTIIASVSALGAVAAAYFAVRVHRDAIGHEAVTDVYSRFNELASWRLEYWQQSHLQELPESYWGIRALVAEACPQADSAEVVRLRLQERAVALWLFSLFEQMCFQLARADGADDGVRAEFLGAVVSYLGGRMLQNPRMRYFWDEEGGNLRAYFEPETVDAYEVNLSDKEFDAQGPFGGR